MGTELELHNSKRDQLKMPSHEVGDNNDVLQNHLKVLSSLFGKGYAFGTDESDEFFVIRENGDKEGIFKTWAIPIIPFIEQNKLDTFTTLWTSITDKPTKTFEQKLVDLTESEDFVIQDLARDAIGILSEWRESRLSNPYKFQIDLEKARVHSLLVDKHLTTIFNADKLPDDLGERISVLVNRFTIASTLESPFYNLEALVGDTADFKWNPLNHTAEDSNYNIEKGGMLDTLAFLLPSAFQEFVIADTLNWNGLNWEMAKKLSIDALQDPKKARILLKLSEITNQPLHRIIFGINTLQWIPTRVGGKKTDFEPDTALAQIENIISNQENGETHDITHIGKDSNALIRFLNWFPVVESERNFVEAADWTYASVCDTANELLNLLTQHPEVWKDNFSETFSSVLLPQLKNLDATSAKGRFLIQLILIENRLKPEYSINLDNSDLKNEYIEKLAIGMKSEYLHVLGQGVQSRLLLGGKAFGLEELINNFPYELPVPEGVVVTSAFINDLIKIDHVLNEMINLLDSEDNLDIKLVLANLISQRIMQIEFPQEFIESIRFKISKFGKNLIVRSSSFDEDTLNGNTGAGIYESIVNIAEQELPLAIKTCLASYFSPKAIQFRNITTHSDKPIFSILIQPYIEGTGGVLFTQDLHNHENEFVIEISEDVANITSGNNSFTTYTMKENEVTQLKDNRISNDNINKLICIAKLIKQLKAKDIDIEWIVDKEDRLWILQSRALPIKTNQIKEKVADFVVNLNIDSGIDTLGEFFRVNEGIGDIILTGNQNLEAFQGDLFRLIAVHGSRIAHIYHHQDIPQTSHFSNICGSLGIKLKKLN